MKLAMAVSGSTLSPGGLVLRSVMAALVRTRAATSADLDRASTRPRRSRQGLWCSCSEAGRQAAGVLGVTR